MTSPAPSAPSKGARNAYAVLALLAWFGMGLNIILTIFNVYPSVPDSASLLGNNPDGFAGVIGRVLDFFTYFTIWSNILVAIIFTMLWRNSDRRSPVFRALFLSSIVMIMVTGIIYWGLLAAGAHLQGLEYVTNTVEHTLVPIITVIVFIVWGPRRLLRVSTVFAALILPIVWAVFALVRGAVIGAYPYGILDVATHGLASVVVTIIEIAILGLILGFLMLLIDRIRSRSRAT